MKLVVGLGNPGEKYTLTRHNVGFALLNAFIEKKYGDGVVWLEETKFSSLLYRTSEVTYAKPQTFMNKVGDSVSKLVHYYQLDLNNLLVVHDDVDLKFGEVKLKKSSGSAGHHGVEDLFAKLGTEDFWRLRVGVGRPADKRFDVEDFVLEKFTEAEIVGLKKLFEEQIFNQLDAFVSPDV